MELIGFKVLLKVIKGDGFEKTNSGLYTPEKQNPNEKAEVIDVGYSTKENEKVIIRTGDIVLIHKGAGYPVVIEGMEYVMMSHDDVACILERNKK